MEIVKTNPNELVTDDYFDLILQMEELQARLNVMDSALNEEIKNYLLETNEKTFEVEKDGIVVKWTYVAPTKTKKCDYAAMKADGIYEKYVRESDKKDFVRRSVSYGD